MKLMGKTVILGITGGIAAYKAAVLCSGLVKEGADVHVIMTNNATEFISPLTLETLSGNRVSQHTFDRNFQWNVQHISLAKKADMAVIAPATANIIAKMAAGIADDMLSTTLLACPCPKLIATAMNTGMFLNPVTQRNISTLKELGIDFIDGKVGMLACKDVGQGRMAEPEEILERIFDTISMPKDMEGLKVVVTAGPTCEVLDPVRYLTNHSSGKMGYELAINAKRRGATVTLISGKTNLSPPTNIKMINIISAEDMLNAVNEEFPHCDILIKAAAVADYKPSTVSENKVKKSDRDLSIPLSRTEDILKNIAPKKKPHQFICGFSMETENLIENSTKKLVAKNLDMIAANNLKDDGAGFGVDTNVVTLITANNVKKLPQLSKADTANAIINEIISQRKINV